MPGLAASRKSWVPKTKLRVNSELQAINSCKVQRAWKRHLLGHGGNKIRYIYNSSYLLLSSGFWSYSGVGLCVWFGMLSPFWFVPRSFLSIAARCSIVGGRIRVLEERKVETTWIDWAGARKILSEIWIQERHLLLRKRRWTGLNMHCPLGRNPSCHGLCKHGTRWTHVSGKVPSCSIEAELDEYGGLLGRNSPELHDTAEWCSGFCLWCLTEAQTVAILFVNYKAMSWM